MANRFATKPELAIGFPVPVLWESMWECPITGVRVPKDPARNLIWRAELLANAEEDEDFQQQLYTMASQSLLLWMNVFGFTLRVFEPSDDGSIQQAENKHLPFVTWPIQDKHLTWINDKIESAQDGLTDKSRDMGATWDHVAVLTWRFLFREDESYLMISRKEDAVDMLDGQPKDYPHGSLADFGTLFGKIDYILSRLPEWMLPRMNRKKLHLVNLDNGSRIDGESANATAGSSDRRTAIFLDEMAKMKEGASIKRSTRDVTGCRLACSTPNGAGTAYSKWRLSGTVDVFILAWWEHPEKGAMRYIDFEEATNRYRIRSPWYDIEAEKRSPKELAIEVDMDHVNSGDTFFDDAILEEHRRKFARDAKKRITLNFKRNTADDAIPNFLNNRTLEAVSVRPKGPWRIWCELPGGRPDQTKNYVMGVDISKGQGASNSVISVMCAETREKIMEFADANTPPYALAKIACAASIWVGGERGLPLLIWENNGDPGFDFGKQVAMTYLYPLIYFDRVAGTMSEKRGKRYGWRSSQEQKAQALGMLRRCYAHGGWITHSHESIDEAAEYVHYESGGLGPAALVEESASARKTHGDRVIADMLCLVGAGESLVARKKTTKTRPPQYSVGGRMKDYRKRKRQARKQNRFDFR